MRISANLKYTPMKETRGNIYLLDAHVLEV